jgi:plastocyanin
MTTIKVDKITPGSGTTTTLGDSGDTFTIPAGVTFANSGSSNMGCQVSYCSTTKSASFTAVANKGYFINTSDASPFLNYAVTVASGSLYVVGGTGNAFYLDGSRTMAITLLKGRTYRFTQTDNTNDGHPLIISTSNSSTLGTMQAGIVSSGVSYYLDGASTQSAYINTTSFNAATTRYIEFQPPATGTYYFACYIHGIGMGGAITSQELTVTLPSSPTVGTEMIIIDSTGDASTNKIIIGRGGSKIKGTCADGELTSNRVGVRLIYSDASQGWVTITSANETAPVINTAQYISATGGTIITCGDYKIHKFASDSNFVVSNAGNACGSNKVDYLVVAGGGGGGGRCNTVGGGGAGGFRTGAVVVPCSATPLVASGGLSVTAQSYPITVGGGGLGGNVPPNPSVYNGAPGSNSVFSTITSAGGGGGGSGDPSSPPGNYKNGGSGGGGSDTNNGGTGNTPPVSPPQGNNGGNGTPPSSRAPSYASGGGGGAGGAGVNATNTKAGNGGDGSPVTAIFGASPQPFYEPTNGLYSGGGGGGFYTGCGAGSPTQGLGGPGGGGAGGASVNSPGTSGTTNTGGGGGGATDTSPYDRNGGNGGSGIVLIRYKYQN